MTSKQAILELIRNLPDNVTADEVVAQILNRVADLQEKDNREKAARLVESWLEDKSGYDSRVWPGVLEGIERNRLGGRPRFESSS